MLDAEQFGQPSPHVSARGRTAVHRGAIISATGHDCQPAVIALQSIQFYNSRKMNAPTLDPTVAAAPSSAPQPGRRASGRRPQNPRRTLEDEQASQMFLAFTRLLRGPRHPGMLPRHVQDLLRSGFLAPRHMSAFAVVALDGPMTVSELAQREGLALSTASLLVTQLGEAGLVERNEDAADRRRTVVSVAPRHRRESEAVLESKLAPLRRALARMGPERAAALLEGLQILVEESIGAEGPSHAREDAS
jgi:DNA-binding MarR family transcriptional regulator